MSVASADPRRAVATAAPQAAPAAHPEATPARPDLRLVPPPGSRRLARLTRLLSLLTLAGFLAVLFGLAAFHASLAQGQYELDDLQEQMDELGERRTELQLTVEELEAPARVATIATELGLRSPEQTVDLHTTTGQLQAVMGTAGDQPLDPRPVP